MKKQMLGVMKNKMFRGQWKNKMFRGWWKTKCLGVDEGVDEKLNVYGSMKN